MIGYTGCLDNSGTANEFKTNNDIRTSENPNFFKGVYLAIYMSTFILNCIMGFSNLNYK